MLEVINDRRLIDKYQKIMLDNLCGELKDTVQNIIGFHGGSREETVHYLKGQNLWVVSSTDVTNENRYWNPFGIEDPTKKGPLNITVEINIPYTHNKRVAGAFIRDDNQIYIGHRGIIGGGKEGISKKLFFELYKGTLTPVKDDNDESQIAIIGNIEDKDLVQKIKIFVDSVYNIKQQNNHGLLEDEDNSGFSPEAEISSPYEINQVIKRDSRHAKIVNELYKVIFSKGLKVCNKKSYDLAILGESGKKTHIFEVKSNTDTTSIYTAVGQLYMHATDKSVKHKVLVVPDDLNIEIKKKLKILSIDVVTYRDDGPILFRGLSEVCF